MNRAFVCLAALCALTACNRAPAPEPATEAPSIATAASLSDPLAQLDGHVVALGDGWRIDAAPNSDLVLAFTAEDRTETTPYTAPRRDGDSATLGGGAFSIALTSASCTQGDGKYPLRAALTLADGRSFVGCAFTRWDRNLTATLPAIDACLSAATEPMTVIYAAPEANGGAFVRLAYDGERYDCRVSTAADAPPPQLEPADPERDLPGEADAIFVRAPGDNPGGECYQAEEVRTADGALIGWMDDPQGC